jgi:hypothetical protein
MCCPGIFPLFILVICFPHTAFGREVKFEKKVDAGALQAQLIAAGFRVSYIECSINRCKITMPDSEKKDPLSEVRKYVFVDAREMREKKLATLRALYDKWETGTISNAEKDELIKNTLGIVLGR